MIDDGVYRIKCRYAVALQKLIQANKKLNRASGNTPHPGADDSYGKLSSSTGIRKGTISDTITAKTDIKGSTLYRLLGALGYSFAQFGAVFDAVTEAEIDAHITLLSKGNSTPSK
ncbi:MAG: hypothetical protein J7599_21770 [Niabella sp.]|nr:hypothetical protein [Niabella sp.]